MLKWSADDKMKLVDPVNHRDKLTRNIFHKRTFVEYIYNSEMGLDMDMWE